jgi:AraC-like DNA-binding protein
VALLLALILVFTSVRRVMDPVNRMFGLLHQHVEAKTPGFRFDACKELEVILQAREQQAAALAQRDAVLSEYFLQSRLKNVYVDMSDPEQAASGKAYILYIQGQYRQACESIAMPRAELEACLQSMLSGTLSNLFESTMVFQLEPGRFAARVTLPEGDDQIGGRMDRFMMRLGIEQEFAWFTVIRSQALEQNEDLSAVYTQVQEAARLAQVCEKSQLLTLPLEADEGQDFVFTSQQEKHLMGYLTEQNAEGAVALVQQMLQENVDRGISRVQMEVLCVALVNTAVHAITRLGESAEKIAASSGVYHLITSQCSTAEDYVGAVTEFIRSVIANEARPVEGDPLLEKISRYLNENYQREFSGEEMAAALHVSRSYLSSYYKSKTGINLNDSIQIFRVQKAVELLQDPKVRLSQVGAMVGMSNSNTFLRWFKKYTGMTPNEYRAKLQD